MFSMWSLVTEDCNPSQLKDTAAQPGLLSASIGLLECDLGDVIVKRSLIL